MTPVQTGVTISALILANGTNAVTFYGAGTTILSGISTYTGTTTVAARTLQIGGSGQLGSGAYAGAIAINAGGTLQYSSSAANQTFSGVISGAGAVLKDTASSILDLSAADSYTGGTTVNAGTLEMDLSARTGSISIGSFAVGSGGTLQLNASTNNSVSGAGGIFFSGGTAFNVTGSGTINKTNSGDIEMGGSTGVGQFSGTINISAGTLGSNGSAWVRPTREATITLS